MEKEQDFLGEVNSIDAVTMAEGTPLAGNLMVLERYGVWQKGKIFLKYCPHFKDGFGVSGPKADGKPVSLNDVATLLGRTTPTVSRWVKFVLEVGDKKAAFDKWAKTARLAIEDKWQKKLTSKDNEDKEPEPDKKKKMEGDTFLEVQDRFMADKIEMADVKFLINEVKRLHKLFEKVQMALIDGKPDKALKVLEGIVKAE